MNKKESNKKTISTSNAKIPVTGQQDKDRFLSYKFETVNDENIYSASFNAKLTEEEKRKMLGAVQNCLYGKIADGIQMYLEQNNIAHSGFISNKMPLEHNRIMEFTECLLHSNACGIFDNYFGNADIFYAIADHQKWTSKNCCHGCYYAVKRIHSKINGLYQYYIIGQTFRYNETNGNESGYFAIRKNRNDRLGNIAVSDNEPVLPVSGCVDMAGILLNIDIIQTLEQVEKIAIK